MLYPFMTLNDGTEIVHSETIETAGKEKVEVRIEKPVYGGFIQLPAGFLNTNGKISTASLLRIFNIFKSY